jgi:hypothetical protein
MEQARWLLLFGLLFGALNGVGTGLTNSTHQKLGDLRPVFFSGSFKTRPLAQQAISSYWELL